MAGTGKATGEAGSSGRASRPRIRWAAVLAGLDLAMVTLAMLALPDVPVFLRAAYTVSLVAVFALRGMYATRHHIQALGRVPLTLGVVTFVTMAFVTIDVLVLHVGLNQGQVLRLWGVTIAQIFLGRLVVGPFYRRMIQKAGRRRALIVGSGFASVLLAEKIESHPELGLVCIGFVDDGPRKTVRGRSEPLLGGIEDVSAVVREVEPDVVIFGYTHNATSEMLLALYEVDPHVEVLMMPRYFQFLSAGMKVDDLAGLPLLRINRSELSATEYFFKRLEDLLLGGVIAACVFPFFPLIALLIKLDSPGPVFYMHERIGRHGKPFRMYKFRSMCAQADRDKKALAKLAADDARGQKLKSDARITRVGAIIRKLSIDELPQIINVLKGEMSLVGPRPAVASEVAAYDEWHKKRLAFPPGITGMWQVHGRSDVPFDERIWLDFMYIDSWSFWLDIGILLQTVPAVLSTKGAY